MGAREDPLGERDRVRRRVEVELRAASALAARAHLHRLAERRGQGVLGCRERLRQVGVDRSRESLLLRLRLTLSLAGTALRLPHRPAAVARLEREPATLGVVLAEEQGAAVALREVAALDQLERLLRKLEQPDQVRD